MLKSLTSRIKRKIKRLMLNQPVRGTYTPEMLFLVERFHRDWQGFRSIEECSHQTGIPLKQCAAMKSILYHNNLLGNYFFAPGVPPHAFMREEVLRRIPTIGPSDIILEVGPGDCPIFSHEDYPGWVMCDPGYAGGAIEFRHFTWGKGKYPEDRSYCASWDTMGDILTAWHNKCDMVIGSHSFEHCFRPITALKHAARLLKPGGWIVLFLPDGFSDDPSNHDPTHTLYAVPGMLEDFFAAAGDFCNIRIEPFRPNADLLVLAQRSLAVERKQ